MVFAFLFLVCFAAAVASGILESQVWESAVYLGYNASSLAFARTGALNFFTFFILMSGIVPLPLYVSLELVKVVHAIWIAWDLDLCLGEEPCKAKSALSDELGQIEYIFSDKTGTMTTNEMVLRHVYAVSDETAVYLALALCHSVLTDESKNTDNDDYKYSAENPDEHALVLGAAEHGCRFEGRADGALIVNNLRYELLHEIAFTSERKRMSVVVRLPDDSILLVCKGAESTLFELLRSDQDSTLVSDKITEFSRQGLRTLCIATRRLKANEFAEWSHAFQVASSAPMDVRGQLVEECDSLLECELCLAGATGVEDLLQDGVAETIDLLRRANIRVWMITGDKKETAENIAASCRLVQSNDIVLTLDGTTSFKVAQQLKDVAQHQAIVVTGPALEHCVGNELVDDFLAKCVQARGVVCCRVSPKLKGAAVKIVRSRLKRTCLAVGDGANDVMMLREADVGVGIFGKEGRAAVMAADYGIAQFRFLGPLILVHGREAYHRVVVLILYTLYKGFSFGLVQFWFSLYTLFR